MDIKEPGADRPVADEELAVSDEELLRETNGTGIGETVPLPGFESRKEFRDSVGKRVVMNMMDRSFNSRHENRQIAMAETSFAFHDCLS